MLQIPNQIVIITTVFSKKVDGTENIHKLCYFKWNFRFLTRKTVINTIIKYFVHILPCILKFIVMDRDHEATFSSRKLFTLMLDPINRILKSWQEECAIRSR